MRVPLRPADMAEALTQAGTRLADEAMAQIRATPFRTTRPLDRAVEAAVIELRAHRVALAAGGVR